MRWADRTSPADADTASLRLLHRTCGQPAEPYLACSHCHEPFTGRDIAPVRGAGRKIHQGAGGPTTGAMSRAVSGS